MTPGGLRFIPVSIPRSGGEGQEYRRRGPWGGAAGVLPPLEVGIVLQCPMRCSFTKGARIFWEPEPPPSRHLPGSRAPWCRPSTSFSNRPRPGSFRGPEVSEARKFPRPGSFRALYLPRLRAELLWVVGVAVKVLVCGNLPESAFKLCLCVAVVHRFGQLDDGKIHSCRCYNK